jgi:hypothetical protein
MRKLSKKKIKSAVSFAALSYKIPLSIEALCLTP